MSCADVIKLVPQLERPITGPPGGPLAELPRCSCVVFIQNKDDPTRTKRVQVYSWCVPKLRDVYPMLDKETSRAVAEQAIQLLVSEINGLKEPLEAAHKFHSLAKGACVILPYSTALDLGIPDI